jgi:hypothetical protein
LNARDGLSLRAVIAIARRTQFSATAAASLCIGPENDAATTICYQSNLQRVDPPFENAASDKNHKKQIGIRYRFSHRELGRLGAGNTCMYRMRPFVCSYALAGSGKRKARRRSRAAPRVFTIWFDSFRNRAIQRDRSVADRERKTESSRILSDQDRTHL